MQQRIRELETWAESFGAIAFTARQAPLQDIQMQTGQELGNQERAIRRERERRQDQVALAEELNDLAGYATPNPNSTQAVDNVRFSRTLVVIANSAEIVSCRRDRRERSERERARRQGRRRPIPRDGGYVSSDSSVEMEEDVVSQGVGAGSGTNVAAAQAADENRAGAGAGVRAPQEDGGVVRTCTRCGDGF